MFAAIQGARNRPNRIERLSVRIGLFVGLAVLVGAATLNAEDEHDAFASQFAEKVRPFLQAYCYQCHGDTKTEADLKLSAFNTIDQVAGGYRSWDLVVERLEAAEMPPADAEKQPADEERQDVIDWLKAFRKHVAMRNAGDPGPVMARRLSNAEFNYTIRDLTGVDIQPAKDFPVDPANEAGFDNSAESLAMSSALLKKYVDAARYISDHMILKPDGFAFAPHPVTTDTDRDKYCVKRIVEFYQRQPTDYVAYFLAAWRYKHRAALGNADASLNDIAAADGVSPKYLATIWSALNVTEINVGPMGKLKSMFDSLPPPDGAQSETARLGCNRMRDYVVELRKTLEPGFKDLDVDGIHKGAQPFVLWKNDQYAAHRRKLDRSKLRTIEADEDIDPELVIPAAEPHRSRHEASFERFCSIFPDAFYISERGRDYTGRPKEQQEKGRLLSAGFHSMMGYYRDDRPLYDLILDESQQTELDALWQELDFASSAPMRQYTGFLWFERTDSRYMRDPEFDFARSEDKNVTSEEMINRLAEVYVAKAIRNGADEVSIQAIQEYFAEINAQIRWVETARQEAVPHHLRTLIDFARRAYRRPLANGEEEDLLAFYRDLREKGHLTHEEAIQDVLVSVLLSPNFCYRMDLAIAEDRTRPLTDYELASRLSYFLWSSMPDDELLAHAAASDLHEPHMLTNQARRMLTDARARALAVEFAGNWLDFRRFDAHNSVDRERFPQFTNELRQAMYEEPIRFFMNVAQEDGSVLDFLYADYTFANSILAQHYGIPVTTGDENKWVRIDAADRHGRGGLLPMSAFLTSNSPGLRTSPVKRGYWVVRRLLGERIPPPPPDVPELPADEAKLGELSLRETLARHRDHKSCAGCHERFDSLGLVFEGYGPIGERRTLDLGGRPVDATAVFPGGSEGDGLEGLRTYLREHRQQDFLDNLCRKLLSYALGRTLMASDDPLVHKMKQDLAADDYRFGSLIESIVTSKQFLNKRGRADLAKDHKP